MKTQTIVVEIHGGCVSAVYSDGAAKNINVIVADWDAYKAGDQLCSRQIVDHMDSVDGLIKQQLRK